MSEEPITFNLHEFTDFFDRVRCAAKGDFKKDLTLFLQGCAAEFLRLVEDEIIQRKVVDTRLLLTSFHEGGDGNVWETSDDGLRVEVGTNVEYASYVNDGHWTCKKGQEKRFVPGEWQGDRFIYDPDTKTGMVLMQKWVEGKHFWESAVRIMERMLPFLLDEKLAEWIEKYFGDM